jgi:hypothetical protein
MARQERSDVNIEIGRKAAIANFNKWFYQRCLLGLLICCSCLLTVSTSLYVRSVSTVTYTVAQTYTNTGQGSVTGM